MKKLVLIPLVLAGFAAIDANACSCAPPEPVEKAVRSATAVFTGRVHSVQPDASGRQLRVRVRVYSAWKGVSRRYVDLRTASNGAMCGYGFQRRHSYLIYAYRDPSSGLLHAGLCSRTKPLAEAETSGELEALGDPAVEPLE